MATKHCIGIVKGKCPFSLTPPNFLGGNGRYFIKVPNISIKVAQIPSNDFLRLKVTEVFQVCSVPSKNPQETSYLEETTFQKTANMLCFVDS